MAVCIAVEHVAHEVSNKEPSIPMTIPPIMATNGFNVAEYITMAVVAAGSTMW